MPFPFSYVCDLLQRIDDNLHARCGQRNNSTIVEEWFGRHQGQLRGNNFDGCAFLSTLLPEKRTDRVYAVQAKTLQRDIARALCLGRSRIAELRRWEEPASGVDLADCVEGILKSTPNACFVGQPDLSVEEIDKLLHGIASACRFSSPAVRSYRTASAQTDRTVAIGNLYKRAQAREAKWLTRLILKDYSPVILDAQLVYRCYHPLLTAVLKVQDDFAVAVEVLKKQDRERGVIQGQLPEGELMQHLKPSLGIKVGRQPWWKARSLRHCLEMGRGRMSCEQKIDGEYCQIHVDLSKGTNCIQIFSKSGKDSTQDRRGLHKAIRASLKLGDRTCPLKTGCILEGELVVFSEKDQKVLDFHKIRKHVSRSGVFLRTDYDSQPDEGEHLMIVYFDLIMVDNESLLAVTQSKRFKRLSQLVTCKPGHAEVVKREVIDFDGRSAISNLKRAFARCIAARDEGLVLKPDDPYFDSSPTRRPYSCGGIKLKKEYIGSFGDLGDFAVVGARYDAAKAKTYGNPYLKWTHFYVGCLDNKDEVERWKCAPRFIVTNVVELNAAQMKAFITHVAPNGVSPEDNQSTTICIEAGIDNGRSPSIIFTDPPVFDLRCFSFHKAGSTGFWSPRFPVVSKIQFERTYRDVVTFAGLQDTAKNEKERPPPEDSQEMLRWMAELEKADPHSILADSATQTTMATAASQTLSSMSSPSAIVSAQKDPARREHLGSEHGEIIELLQHPTLPTSAINSTSIPEGEKAVFNTPSPIRPSKRPRESPLRPHRSSKSQKRHDMSTPASSRSPQLHQPASQSSFREPLADITCQSSPRDNSGLPSAERLPATSSFREPSTSATQAGVAPRAASAPVSFRDATPDPKMHPREGSSTLSGVPPSSGVLMPDRPPDSSPPSKCLPCGNSCALRGFSVLLAPCIAQYSWVTQDLLLPHGITSFIVDPRLWKGDVASTEKRATSASMVVDPDATSPGLRPGRRRRVKKLVLVESRRKEATKEFLEQIEAAGLTRRDGRREYVDVFDWRVLEALAREEAKLGMSEGSRERNGQKASERTDIRNVNSILRRYWIGLA